MGIVKKYREERISGTGHKKAPSRCEGAGDYNIVIIPAIIAAKRG